MGAKADARLNASVSAAERHQCQKHRHRHGEKVFGLNKEVRSLEPNRLLNDGREGALATRGKLLVRLRRKLPRRTIRDEAISFRSFV